jgi:hypothetical protein
MAFTSTTTFDVVNQTQTITFYESNIQVDQIVFSGNGFTFEPILTFNLSKSDLLLYFQYLGVFTNTINTNFPSVRLSANNAWPLCQFNITESSIGVTKIIYTQNSQSNNIYTITYLPIAQSASFAARPSPIAITIQEFFMSINMLLQYSNQVSLN